MKWLDNPLRGQGLTEAHAADVVTDPAAAQALFAQCPVASETPLLERRELAEHMGIGALWLKDERDRLGLGSFKALGAAHAIARAASMTGNADLSRAPFSRSLAAKLSGTVSAR